MPTLGSPYSSRQSATILLVLVTVSPKGPTPFPSLGPLAGQVENEAAMASSILYGPFQWDAHGRSAICNCGRDPKEGPRLRPMPLLGIDAHDRDLSDVSRSDRSWFSNPRQPVEPHGSRRQHYPGQVLQPE